ncbi:MAG: hypothetical protein QOD25_2441 [Alphaproteobacteria bacterium]|nr:hypothetical protein [Alphaproteobacteria bacterium]
MEQELSASLGERQVTEFIEDDEVDAREIVGEATGAAGPSFCLKPVDEIDGVEEPATRPATDATACDRHREVCLARAGRTSVILPGVWRARSGFDIRSIHEAVNSS